MDIVHQTFAIQADRPLLGAFALAACLAGGTATQNHAGVPRAIDTARFGSGWAAGAPRQPDRAISAMAATLTPPAPARAFSAPRVPVAAVAPEKPRLIRAVTSKQTTAARPAPKPAVERAAALALPASARIPASANSATPLPASVVPSIETAPTATLASVTAPPPVAMSAAVKTIETVPAPMDSAPLQLVSSPELRRFDLAKFSSASPRPARLAASRKAASAPSAKARPADRLIDGVVYHHASVEVAGQAGGDIAVRIGPDMKPSVKVADLLGLVSAQMDPETLARFQLASSAGEYVSFAALRTAGFDVKYNAAADSIAISVAP